jgi:uncharacterized damage-inducible protein DinB
MQRTDTLTTLYKHHLWANLRLLEQCKQLSSEQMEATIPGAQGTLHDTLQHIVNAERSYHSRITTGQMYRGSGKDHSMTLDEMMESLQLTGTGLIDWATKVQAHDTVQLDWDGIPREVPKTIILTQVINHATEHREQVKAIMSQLGLEPPDLQAWSYFDELDV